MDLPAAGLLDSGIPPRLMQFNSTTFIFFLIAVYFVYWAIARFDRALVLAGQWR